MSKSILTDCNVIKQVAVSEILDGRYFFIPSYQRGYRWTKTQVYDLCNDLLEYALKPKANDRPKAFYSLQPLIVRKGIYDINGEKKEAYEVVDGQQRLTTLFVMYRFLMKRKKIMSIQELKDDWTTEMYHIYYETRPNDFNKFEKLGFESLLNSDVEDIDIAHISNSFQYMEMWINPQSEEDKKECAQKTFELNSKESFKPITVIDKLFKLLNNEL